MRIRLFAAEVTALEDERNFARALASVDERRREKVLRLRRAEDRRLSICAGLLLREGLRLCGAPEGLRIAEGEHGKPYFPDAPQWHFSLSHSGRYALCAIGDAEVGCDIEKTGAANIELARRFFHPDEVRELESDPSPEAFCRMWTRKESFVKATGEGLARRMDSFSTIPDEVEGLRISSFADIDGYWCSVCAEASTEKIRIEQVEIKG